MNKVTIVALSLVLAANVQAAEIVYTTTTGGPLVNSVQVPSTAPIEVLSGGEIQVDSGATLSFASGVSLTASGTLNLLSSGNNVWQATSTAFTVNLPMTASGTFTGSFVGTCTALAPVATISALKALLVSGITNNSTIILLGYHAAGDNGGGTFYYDASSIATDNGGTIIAPNSGTGRWIRQYSGQINVAWFGAYGDGTHDDTTAIQAASDYANSLPAVDGLTQKAVIYFPPTIYFLTTATITVPAQVGVIMDGSIKYQPANQTSPCLVIGSAGMTNRYCRYNLSVSGSATADWANTAYVGIKLINANDCQITIRRCSNFAVGLQLLGDGDGVQYNTFTLGDFVNNQYGIYITSANSGWVNENLYLNGNFTVTNSGSYYTTNRAAVWMTTGDNNVFIKPSFQIGPSSGGTRGYPIIVTNAVNNTFANCRFEGVSYAMSLTGTSFNNTLTVGYTGGMAINSSTIVDTTSSPGSTIVTSINKMFGFDNISASTFTAQGGITAGSAISLSNHGPSNGINYETLFKSYAATAGNFVLAESLSTGNATYLFDLKSDSTASAPGVGLRILTQSATGSARSWAVVANDAAGGDFRINHSTTAAGAPTTNVAAFSDVGDFSLASTTDSSSPSTGSLKTTGGLGVAKNANVGGALGVTGASALAGGVTIGSGGSTVTKVRFTAVTLSSGTAAVTDTAITTNSRIAVFQVTPGGTPGACFCSDKTAGSGYTITSTSALDASAVSVEIIEP